MGLLGSLDPLGLRAGRAPRVANRARARASSATCTVSRTVRSAKSAASWNVRPRPSRARRAALMSCTSVPGTSITPLLGR